MNKENKKRGWVRRYRSIQDHWLYKCKPFCKVAAWDDLILKANFDSKKISLGNQFVEVGRGELITSEVKLSQCWGWSRTKVRAFLNQLQNDSMIEKKSDNKKTWVKVLQYSVYNDTETAEVLQKNIKKTSKKHQKNTNNNKKEINNKEEIKTLTLKHPGLVIFFYETLPEKMKKMTVNNLLGWDNDFDKLIRLDGKTENELKVIIQYFRNDPFWTDNFHSPCKLRKNNKDNIKFLHIFEEKLNKKSTQNNNQPFDYFRNSSGKPT